MKIGQYLGYLGKVYHIVSHFITIHDQFNDRKTSSSLEKAGVASVVLKGLRSDGGPCFQLRLPTGRMEPGLAAQVRSLFQVTKQPFL